MIKNEIYAKLRGEIMRKKIFPIINLGLAVLMLFFALPKIGTSAEPIANVFWLIWIAFAAIVMTANGNVLLMSEEKKVRLKQLKQQRAMRFERKVLAMQARREQTLAKKNRQKVKDTA